MIRLRGFRIRHLLTGGVAAALAGFGLNALAFTGYVTDAQGELVRDAHGKCVRDVHWTPADAIAQCDPALVAVIEPERPEVLPEPVPPMRQITFDANTNFDFDDASLTDQGRRLLDEIAQIAEGAVDVDIRITGFTDHIGDPAYNLQLAEERAQSVRDYLVEQGVAEEVITVAAAGEADPLPACQGLTGDALIECLRPNRRTEIEFSAFEPLDAAEPEQRLDERPEMMER